MSENEVKENGTPQNNNTNNITTGEADKDLIRMADRLAAQAVGIAHANYKLGAIVIICSVLIIAAAGWVSYRVEHISAQQTRVSKHVWELKSALGLKFSQERSAAKATDAEAETEMP